MDKKKQWQQPVLLVMPANNIINGGGPNPSLKEIHTGHHHISSVAHGVATVSTAAYNNVMS